MVPPCEPRETSKDTSIIIPPFQAHPNQEEIFLVTAGTALFHLNRQKIALFAWETDMPICEPSKLHRLTLCSCLLIVLVVALGVPKIIGIPITYGMTWVLGVFVGK